jgi:hypothetical protein
MDFHECHATGGHFTFVPTSDNNNMVAVQTFRVGSTPFNETQKFCVWLGLKIMQLLLQSFFMYSMN